MTLNKRTNELPAASNGVAIEILIIAPRGGELNLHPPPEDSSASGGLVRLWRTKKILNLKPTI
jgi:hypothetical protein